MTLHFFLNSDRVCVNAYIVKMFGVEYPHLEVACVKADMKKTCKPCEPGSRTFCKILWTFWYAMYAYCFVTIISIYSRIQISTILGWYIGLTTGSAILWIRSVVILSV